MTNENSDLTECDREPIHIPSAIQPHGFFIVVDPKNERIISASVNIDHYFTFSAHAMLNQQLETFSPLLSEWLRTWSNQLPLLPQVFALSHTREATRFVVTMHRSDEYFILEGEPAQKADLFPEHLAQSVIYEAINLSRAKSVIELCQLGVLSLQRLSGFGRVMVYQFDEEYNGCVTAEAKIPSMHSYLDHHFPAADIPVQARELYRTNLIRFIPTATYEPVPLQSILDKPIDMSQSTLRSVSPIHLEYLRNMEVGASMSLSIIVNGELWGLFAAHHPIGLSLAPTVRRYCEMFIKLFNALIQEKIANESSQAFFDLKNRHMALKEAFSALSLQFNVHDTFKSLGKLWMDALDSDGVCLIHADQVTTIGTVPEYSTLLTLSDKMNPLHQNDLFSSSSLQQLFTDVSFQEPTAGALSLIVSHEPYTQLIWFRNEWIRELKWAGDPNKPETFDPNQRISPRLSFQTLLIKQKGKSRLWNNTHIMAAELYKDFGAEIELDTVRQTVRRQQKLLIQQRKMAMMGEMIDAITHQWNQPLNALSLLISGLTELMDDTDPKTIADIKKTGMEKIRFMSETIDSFRNFFKPDRKCKTFSIMQSIHEVSDQLLPQIKLHKIELIVDGDSGNIEGYPNEFKQVILNLLSNAHDVLLEKEVKDPWIRCKIVEEETQFELSVCDNGGGIDSESLEKLFVPYFSTKGEEKGRGLGLYLSKMIIEEHFKGSISVHNSQEGACFALILPKSAS